MAPPSFQITLLRVRIRKLIHDTRYLDVVPMFLLLALIRYLYTGFSSVSLSVVLLGWEKASPCSQILLRLALKYIDAEKYQHQYQHPRWNHLKFAHVKGYTLKSLFFFKLKKYRRVVELFRNKWIARYMSSRENQKQPPDKGL